MSAVDFWCQWILAALWWGDGFVYVPVRDASGAPKPPLWQFNPEDVDDPRRVVLGVGHRAGRRTR